MKLGSSFRRLAVIAMIIGLAASGVLVGDGIARQSPSRITIDAARARNITAVTPTQIRNVEERVSRLPATLEVRTTAEAGTPPPSEARPVAVAPEAAQEAPGPNEIQYVQTSPQLDRQIATALATRPGISQFITGGGELQAFSGVLRQADEAGQTVQLKAYALIGQPLAYDPASGLFNGEIRLGVAELVPGPRRRLSTPINFEVIGAQEVDPEIISMEETSPPHRRVRVRMAAAGRIRVASDLIPEGVDLDMPLAPVLSILPGSPSIDGWGLGTTDINISVTGPVQPGARFVDLRASSGFLDRTRVPLDEHGNATVSIRSDRIGTARITAATPGYRQEATEVDFRFPYTTLLAGLLGGLVGAGIRVVALRRLTMKRAVLALLGGVLVGALIFALYAVGVNVLPVAPTVTVGAVLVFAISGLGAFLGSRRLEASD